ncbi:unnamed protein product [Calypogeia fissa]
MQSGVNTPEAENQEGAELQDEEVMKALYNTKGFLHRNVLQVRQKSMEGTTPKNTTEPSRSATPTSECTDLPSSPQPQKGPEKAKSTVAKPPTIPSTEHPTKMLGFNSVLYTS